MSESHRDAGVSLEDDTSGLSLVALIKLIWTERWLIGGITAIFAIASIAYALLATEWYEAEVLLAPAESQTEQGLASQFGGLASLAGISLSSESSAEPIAVLRSREFAREFIRDKDLLPVLFADEWDAQGKRWRSDDPDEQPDIRDAVKHFRENLLRVSEDSQTGLVTLRVEWTDPDIAADWALQLVDRLNERMRQRALRDADRNVEFLRSELDGVNILAIQQSIGRLLETEMQKLMLARGNREFSLRIIDPASPPKYRSRPKRTLLVITSTILGGLLGVFTVLLIRVARRQD